MVFILQVEFEFIRQETKNQLTNAKVTSSSEITFEDSLIKL